MNQKSLRTTLTLDEDVAAKLSEETRRTGKSFRQVVNEMIRFGFAVRQNQVTVEPFVVRARPLGLPPGLSYDCVDRLLEQLEGPFYR